MRKKWKPQPQAQVQNLKLKDFGKSDSAIPKYARAAHETTVPVPYLA